MDGFRFPLRRSFHRNVKLVYALFPVYFDTSGPMQITKDRFGLVLASQIQVLRHLVKVVDPAAADSATNMHTLRAFALVTLDHDRVKFVFTIPVASAANNFCCLLIHGSLDSLESAICEPDTFKPVHADGVGPELLRRIFDSTSAC